MGDSTDFSGQFDCTPDLKPEHAAYLKQFAETRRMKRDASKALLLPDPIREAAGLPIGDEAANFVAGGGDYGQNRDESVVDGNTPPAGQPGVWCQWVPTPDNKAIKWDGGDTFYNYVEWLEYLIASYLQPWGYVLNGTVKWQGDERDDLGQIEVANNAVNVKRGEIIYG